MRRFLIATLLMTGCNSDSGSAVIDSDETEDTQTTPPGDDDDDDDDDVVDTDDTDTDTTPPCAQEVTDPGNAASPSDWTAPTGNISPERAYPVGVVNGAGNAPTYIGTVLPNNEDNAYWVFKTGPSDFGIPLRVQNAARDFESMHLHDGEDLCFGAEIPPTEEDIGAWYIESRFPVEADHVYVLEVRVPGGGFF